MAEPRVSTFFYGSFIDLEVLKEQGVRPDPVEVAVLHGFEIRIEPLANLARSGRHRVYGIVAGVTHDELGRLYQYATDCLGGVYLPEAVLVEAGDAKWLPALCYIAPVLEPKPASNDYIDRIAQPARSYGFPAWYIERLESFRP